MTPFLFGREDQGKMASSCALADCHSSLVTINEPNLIKFVQDTVRWLFVMHKIYTSIQAFVNKNFPDN